MSNRVGLDYSWGRPDLATVAAAGYSFIARYLSYDGGKNISPDEAARIQSLGMDIVLVWETTAKRVLSGWPGGISDAATALGQANTVGLPSTAPIYFAVDYDTPEGDQATIDQYLRGAASVLGPERVGVYGSYYVVERSLTNGSARYGWQTLAWSGGQVSSRAHVYQDGGQYLGADTNRALQPYFGQYGPSNPIPVPENEMLTYDDPVVKDILTGIGALEYEELPDVAPFSRPKGAIAVRVDAIAKQLTDVKTALDALKVPPAATVDVAAVAVAVAAEMSKHPLAATLDVEALSASVARRVVSEFGTQLGKS